MALKSSLLFAIGALTGAAFAQSDSLRWDEFHPRLMTDFGHIVQGNYSGNKIEFQPLNRDIVVLEQSAAYGNWSFDGGFKAIMWWPFPAAAEPLYRTLRVEPRLSQAKARYNFTEDAFLEFGFFPYKYNPDAQNLGEYLYRSGTYPGVIRTTDGFHLMNYAVYEAYGAHLHYAQLGGRVTHDFNLFTEPTSIPIGDLTPGYELSVNLPLVQFGVGAAYNRLISYDPEKNRPKVAQNGYFVVDSVGGGGTEFAGPLGLLPQSSSVRTRIDNGDSTVRRSYYYTQRGVKLMARAAIDLGFLLPEDLRNPGDLRLFTEAALLGWENQPYFYEDRTERIPVMFGVNLPTLRVLDQLTVQGEYYRGGFDNTYDYDYYAYPTWNLTLTEDPAGSGNYVYHPDHRDDWKWSVNARKRVNRLLTVNAQVANDHLRLRAFNLNPTGLDLTRSPSDWYYLLRLECTL